MVSVDLDGLISAYSPLKDEVVFLNATASDVWRLADGEHTVDEVAALLAAAYARDAGALRGDVARLLADLAEAGLLPGGAPPAAQLALRVLDVPVRLLVQDPAPAALLEGLWTDCRERQPAPGRPLVVRV